MNKLYRLLVFFVSFSFYSSSYSQVNIIGKEVLVSEKQIEEIRSKLNDFEIFSLKVPDNIFKADTVRVELILGAKYSWNLNLVK